MDSKKIKLLSSGITLTILIIVSVFSLPGCTKKIIIIYLNKKTV